MHARNEGPGGCVPWGEHERLRKLIDEAIDVCRNDEEWPDADDAIAQVELVLMKAKP